MRRKSIKEKLFLDKNLSLKWKIVHTLGIEFGWEIAGILGWLIEVGDLGLSKHQLHYLSGLSKYKFDKRWEDILQIKFIEQVVYTKQKNLTGARINWDTFNKLYPAIRYSPISANRADIDTADKRSAEEGYQGTPQNKNGTVATSGPLTTLVVFTLDNPADENYYLDFLKTKLRQKNIPFYSGEQKKLENFVSMLKDLKK